MTPRKLRLAGDGLTLAADGWGSPSDEPVLLLHGGGQTRHAWDATARALAERGYYAVSVDARGHGESDWCPGARYQLEHFSTDLKLVVASFDRPPVIVGASLGGYMAMLGVGQMGVIARAMVLVDIAPRIEPEGVARIFEFMTAYPKGFASVDEAADAVADYLPHRRRPKNLNGLHKNLRLRDDGRYYWHYDPNFIATIRADRPSGELVRDESIVRNITIPTLLIRGKLSDLLSEDGARHFLELVPHAEYVDVSGAAHMVAGDANDRFSGAVIAFLEEQRRAARSEARPTPPADT